jgi:protein-ribulosamine 3-kinase
MLPLEDDREQKRTSPPKLTDPALRIPLEAFLSRSLGREWKVRKARDMADFACHPAAILSDGAYPVFAKFSDAPDGLEQFEVELDSLRFLAGRSGTLIPTPIGILPLERGSLLILEQVTSVERSPLRWRQIGQALSRLHQVKAGRFGLDTHCYFGPLYQENTPVDSWPEFYAGRRLLPGLKMAVDSGNLPLSLAGQLGMVIARLPRLCGPEVIPSLIHGDAQQNNFISSEQGAYIIDPAAYFGHPEMDLAWLDAFQPVPQDVFDGYQEQSPIDPGFWERRPLWRIWGYLAAVAVDGEAYLGKLSESIQRCL